MAIKVTGGLYESLMRQIAEIMRQIHQPGGYPFDPARLHQGLQRLIEGLMDSAASATYPITVDYGLSVEAMVKAGRYDWVNDYITSRNFPTKKKGKKQVVVELIHLNRSVSTDDALKELDKMGMRPAELHELLALGQMYPELQREFPVVALGSVWQNPNGNRYVSYLSRDDSERNLYLDWFEVDWYGFFRFAAVRK
ncbi:MAG: hypothetical protein COT89_01875 [Candidatus Colwellbacteria bacterium CG10_big_fil_rev_8_21_14_0_10_42_22]|uniref:Uncharacterized protein n=1 Tax=Candidatus Colwellbacteria bacterium CG10_big_fil_rev_8_21_14_0_10_42_22 TaxID=1974540 RepID=A0A2H0VHZ5_9BACT|nr:MAG: hypothetical protein COT89_01875 [Candidatus Colwellbacteria bacterium CG10_big_fil_rev_8_21_14_0_10_42_22]